MSLAILWFRRDLRLVDNAALLAACERHERLLPVYLHVPGEEGQWRPGAASRWWLHYALEALDRDLHHRHGTLLVRAGESSLSLLSELAQETGAEAVYWNRLYEPAAIQRDKTVKLALREQGIQAHSYNAALWREPWTLATGQGTPFRVFSPYWRRLRGELEPEEPLPEPKRCRYVRAPHGLPLAALGLLPEVPWDAGLRSQWTPGEAGAREMLDLFIDDALGGYAQARDLPGRHGTSRLSPHLHFGEISPRQVHHALQHRVQTQDLDRRPDLEPFLRELGWREFAHHLLFHFPGTPSENFNPRFDGFVWNKEDADALQRWQRGCTGIPLVDAGMRELWHTGWMHNRVRMVVASFLTKNLRQHWLQGTRWFWDTLVDADLANNTLGWQWVAGCGADAAPYFRVFNPLAQARKFDPHGDYLRRWLPECAGAPLEALFDPLRHAEVLGCLGYPAPMVDLASSRQQALGAFARLRE